MPIYAECGGLMYLCDSIENLESIEYDMVGIFPFKSKMTKRLQRFGYVEVEVASDSPISSEHEETFKAHEFHRSIVEHGDKGNFAYHVTKARPGENMFSGRVDICIRTVLEPMLMYIFIRISI